MPAGKKVKQNEEWFICLLLYITPTPKSCSPETALCLRHRCLWMYCALKKWKQLHLLLPIHCQWLILFKQLFILCTFSNLKFQYYQLGNIEPQNRFKIAQLQLLWTLDLYYYTPFTVYWHYFCHYLPKICSS